MISNVLYSFRRCPYAMRARLALWICGGVVTLREVKLSAKPEAMVALSPKATVPVLQLANGAVIDQSLDIMRWALAQADPEGWLQRDDEALIAENDGAFKHSLDRYKYPDRHGSDALEHRALGLTFLRLLDERIAARGQLAGASRGFVDMAIMPFVRQFAAAEPLWFAEQSVPHLQSWLSGHAGSDLFAAIMVRYRPWVDGDEPIFFGAAVGG